jgi:hypothetical protein
MIRLQIGRIGMENDHWTTFQCLDKYLAVKQFSWRRWPRCGTCSMPLSGMNEGNEERAGGPVCRRNITSRRSGRPIRRYHRRRASLQRRRDQAGAYLAVNEKKNGAAGIEEGRSASIVQFDQRKNAFSICRAISVGTILLGRELLLSCVSIDQSKAGQWRQ